MRRPPGPTLFPYTTLFRSTVAAESASRESESRRSFVASGPKDLLRSEEHTSELQSLRHLVCRLLPEKNTPYLYSRCQLVLRPLLPSRHRVIRGSPYQTPLR